MRQKRRLSVFVCRVLRRIFMSKKDEETSKWTNFIMRKIEEISEYYAYNRVKTKKQYTFDAYKYTSFNIQEKQ